MFFMPDNEPSQERHTIKGHVLSEALQNVSLTRAEGIRYFKAGEYPESIENIVRLSQRFLGGPPIENEYILIENVIINSETVIKVIGAQAFTRKRDIIFYNCILPGLSFTDVKIDNVYIIQSIILNVLELDSSIIDRLMICDNTVVTDGVLIDKKSSIRFLGVAIDSATSRISIKNESWVSVLGLLVRSKCGDILIEGSKCDNIGIRQDSFAKSITVFNKAVTGRFLIAENSAVMEVEVWGESQTGIIDVENKSAVEKFNIKGKSLAGDINIREYSLCGQIKVRDNSRMGDIRVRENSYCGKIVVRNSSCVSFRISKNQCSLELYNATVSLMDLTDCIIQELTWQAGTKGELYITRSSINHLNLNHTSVLKDALISISDSQIFVAEMNKLVVLGQIVFTNIHSLEKPEDFNSMLQQFPQLSPPEDDDNVVKENVISLKEELITTGKQKTESKNKKLVQEVSNKPLWRIANSTLGKTEITGCDLTGFVFEYRNSRILDIFISGTQLPKGKIEIYDPGQEGKMSEIDFFEQQISVYSQLKKIFDNQGNIVEATWYHSKAMEKQQDYLTLTKEQKKKGWFSEEGFDLFNFKLNKWSNNHGESWRRALWFVLLTSFIIYCLYYLSLYYSEPFSFKATGRFIGNFFSFLNIARKDDFIGSGEYNSGMALFLSLLGRIVTGFGIYQLIAAFRRHGRK